MNRLQRDWWGKPASPTPYAWIFRALAVLQARQSRNGRPKRNGHTHPKSKAIQRAALTKRLVGAKIPLLGFG
jgi:hypothetical protein